MSENIAYLTDTSKIHFGKMNFTVINLRPKQSDKYNALRLETERKLFEIFKKYV